MTSDKKRAMKQINFRTYKRRPNISGEIVTQSYVLPISVAAAVHREAVNSGKSKSDIVTQALAKHYGIEITEGGDQPEKQEALA